MDTTSPDKKYTIHYKYNLGTNTNEVLDDCVGKDFYCGLSSSAYIKIIIIIEIMYY